MAVKPDLTSTIEYTDAWDQHTGEQVEDALTRAIQSNANNAIVGGRYENEKLTLIKADNTTLDPIEISVIEATYDYGIYIYGLKVDGTVIKRDNTEQIIQYNKNKTYQIGIAAYATATTNSTSDRNISLDLEVTYGSKTVDTSVQVIKSSYFSFAGDGSVNSLIIPEGESADDIVKWLTVDELFTSSYTSGLITATLIPDQTSTKTYSSKFNTPITVQVISLSYKGDYYTNSNYITFTLSGGNSGNYKLEGLNGDEVISASGMSVSLSSGLNQLVVRAVHTSNNSIYTDWYYLDIINTNDCNDVVVAINKVSDTLPNNAIATLYDLTVYSAKKDSTTITTYLQSGDPSSGNIDAGSQLKVEQVTSDSYTGNNEKTVYHTQYYKYLENQNTTIARRYLIVKVGEDYYNFNDVYVFSGSIQSSATNYKSMTIAPINSNYCYYSTGVTYNFDQIVGRQNNIFKTKEYFDDYNIPDNIEASDGWQEDRGILSFKISAQDTPIVTLSDLNLGSEFTLETKFKTSNISDETKPILTLGKMQLLPTQFGYSGDFPFEEVSTGKYGEGMRNSIFRANTDIHLLVTVKRNFTIDKDDPYYPDYMQEGDTYSGSFQEIFDKAMSSTTSTSNKYNLVRIFINGCIDREYILTDDEFSALKNSSLIINPTTADVNFYILRIYNQEALEFEQVKKNYISSLMNDVSNENDDPKADFFDKNDIVDDNGRISFAKAYKKFNTIVLVFPTDPEHPNRTNLVPTRAWGGKDNADPHPDDYMPVTMFIGYKDSAKNSKYGGRLTNTRVRGQGTSAMRYWIWNPATHITKAKKYVTDESGNISTSSTEKAKSKFTPYSNLDTKTNTFTSKNNVLSKYYLMPGDDDIKVTKAVGKVNYASSMQNHKIGCTDLYNAFYLNETNNKISVGGMELGGKKAVKEEPFLYFYVYADRYDVSDFELSEVLASDVKFMGFLTWGSGKGDNETFAIDSDRTPGYLFLEGGENSDIAVQFRVPWQAMQRNSLAWTDLSTNTLQSLQEAPQISYAESLERPWDHLFISGDESIIYESGTEDVTGAWDVNNGLEELDNGAFRLDVGTDEAPNKYLRQSIKTWREFYDFVYLHDWDILPTSDPISANWDTSKKVCCTNSTCDVTISNGVHTANDCYRYDTGQGRMNGKWVRAGVSYDSGEWSAFNIITYAEELSADLGESTNIRGLPDAKAVLRRHFSKIAYNVADAKNSGTLDIKDASIHQALIRWVSGTDNRAKNTYFRVVGPILTSSQKEVDGVPQVDENGDPVLEWNEPDDYADNPRKYHFVGFLQDDVDTILATDNNGLQSKSYNLLEPSYYNESTESSYIKQWGDSGGNVFFRCFDQVYEDTILAKLSDLIGFSLNSSREVSSTGNRLYQYFFNIQNEYFPAVAYNHTAKIYYELGQLVLQTGAISDFSSNDQDPIAQSHGSCIESELSYMQKRYTFLGSQAKNYTNNTDALSMTSSAAGSSHININLEYSLNQDAYPLFHTTSYNYILYNQSPVNAIGNANYIGYKDSTARNNLATEGTTYNSTININSATNNNLMLMSKFKTLVMKGYQGSTLSLTSDAYNSLISFKIDNKNRGDYAESAITDQTFIPQFPVAKTITMANMTLPTTLDFSNCGKLENLNLSGSTVEKVILPKTSHLQTVTLPATLTSLTISNAPNLSTLTLEGIASLTEVDINCDKVGSLDLYTFLEQLASCPSLSSVVLRNLDHKISAEALKKLILVKANLSGKLTVANSDNQLVDISYSDKANLVELYGNIDSEANSLYIKYKESIAYTISCETEVSVYGDGYSGNPFGLSIDGNNVALTTDNGKVVPDITYKFNSSVSDVATIDSRTGVITMKQESSSKTTTATITVKLTNGNKLTSKTITIYFSWKAPEIGNFVYADGTYSNAYMTSKTLMGLIYALDSTTTNGKVSGTAYVVGKEYLTSQYVGYSNEGASGASDARKNLYNVGYWLDNQVSGLSDTYYIAKNVTSSIDSGAGEINVKTFTTEKAPSTFTGKEDTAAYVQHVNDTLLPLIVKKYSNLINTSGDSYSISNTANLNTLLDSIPNINNQNLTEMQCLLFPYFYETYLYEPEVTDAEKKTDAFKNYFSSGNWYVPSYQELATLIYYRGYSAAGENFSTGEIPINSNISDSITKGSGNLKNPIFSTAYKNAGSYMPQAWNSIASSQNLCTNTDSSGHNYTYQQVTNYSGSSTNYSYEWLAGTKSNYDYGYDEAGAASNGWRLILHKPLPCVQFKYSEQ